MKITNPKRLTIFAIIILLIITALAIKVTGKAMEIDHTEDYTIQNGDTLWAIGTEYRPERMSIQEYIYNLEQYNGITPELHPEQKIKILIYKEG